VNVNADAINHDAETAHGERLCALGLLVLVVALHISKEAVNIQTEGRFNTMKYPHETHQRIIKTLKRIHTDLKGVVTDRDAFEELVGIHEGMALRSGIYLEVLILQDEFTTRDNPQDQLEMVQGLEKIEAYLNKIEGEYTRTRSFEFIMLLLRNTVNHFSWLTGSYMPEWGVSK